VYRDAIAENAPIDLVIMDLTVEDGMGGKEAAKKIFEFDPKAKIVVSSGYPDDPLMEAFADYGFCAALVKPFKLRELLQVIKKFIGDQP
jgi:DNA-binding NarL/FixJ family response regulator